MYMNVKDGPGSSREILCCDLGCISYWVTVSLSCIVVLKIVDFLYKCCKYSRFILIKLFHLQGFGQNNRNATRKKTFEITKSTLPGQ